MLTCEVRTARALVSDPFFFFFFAMGTGNLCDAVSLLQIAVSIWLAGWSLEKGYPSGSGGHVSRS